MAVAPQKSWTRWLPVMIPYGWLLFFFLVPFLIVAKISVSSTETAIPPYMPVFDPLVDGMSGIWEKAKQFTTENYTRLVESDLYWRAYLSSLWIAFVSTLITLLIGYPMAYGMARAPAQWRPLLLMLVIEGILGAARLAGWQESFQPSALLLFLMLLSFISFAWRAAMRFAFTTREYGVIEGVISVLRIPVANIIAIMAGRRALLAYMRTLGGEEVSWDKTRHGSHPASIVAQARVA